jgi:PAS domain-containing protein
MSAADPHPVLARAVDLVRDGSAADLAELDHTPMPLYATDADGVITYYNAACVDFAGRAATVGEDRWCVTWKLFTDDGEALPHDQCPMAVAIRERREVRGLAAVAARPDGTRRRFLPYPTPVIANDGRLLGAVNIFAEAKLAPTAAELRARARRWRRVALSVDPQTAADLETLGGELESQADRTALGEGS